jgi:molecular chaperone HtpG
VDEQHAYIEEAKEKGYTVLLLDSQLTGHFVQHLEQKLEKSSFVRVDGDTIDKLIKKDEEIPSKLSEEDEKTLKPIFEAVVPKEKFTVQFESLSEKSNPVSVTRSEFMRRMQEMSQMGGGGMMMGNMPEMYNLVVNANHPLIGKILSEKDENKKKELSKQATDLALLSQNLLKGEELTQFIKRSINLIH